VFASHNTTSCGAGHNFQHFCTVSRACHTPTNLQMCRGDRPLGTSSSNSVPRCGCSAAQAHGTQATHGTQAHGTQATHGTQPHGLQATHGTQAHGTQATHGTQTHGTQATHGTQTHGTQAAHALRLHMAHKLMALCISCLPLAWLFAVHLSSDYVRVSLWCHLPPWHSRCTCTQTTHALKLQPTCSDELASVDKEVMHRLVRAVQAHTVPPVLELLQHCINVGNQQPTRAQKGARVQHVMAP